MVREIREGGKLMSGLLIILYFFLVGVVCYVVGKFDGKERLDGKEKDIAIKHQEIRINKICGIEK